MTEETLSKKFIGAGVLVACIGFALGVTGYGYKQIKDAHFLNTDTTRIISVKGVSQMEVNSDKAILSFFLSGKGSSEESAIKAFGVLEKDMYKKLDPKIASRLDVDLF